MHQHRIVVQQLSPVVAKLSIQSRGDDEPIIGGRLVGPISHLGRTLTSRWPLTPDPVHPGAPRGGAWSVTVPEPAGWSPDSPTYYQLHLVTQSPTGGTTELPPRNVAFRLLGCRRGGLYWEGRRWVPRIIVPPESASSDDREIWREAYVCWIVDPRQSKLLDAATRWGIPVIADLISLAADHFAAACQSLADIPALIAVLVSDHDVAAVRSRLPGTLVARLWSDEPARSSSTARDPPDLWFVREATVIAAARPALDERPRIVARGTLTADWRAARAEADRLQAATAGSGDWAGYCVVSPDRWR